VNPLKQFADALHDLNVPFTVVGSLASSARGVPRATKDVDLVARIGPPHVEKLVSALGSEWYADAEQMQEALVHGRAFNVIHLASGWKVDIFPATSEFHESELRRATIMPLVLENDVIECPVSSAEDVLLAKLRWYLDGGRVSDRQWNDIAGIIGTNPGLDRAYLRRWAGPLGVRDLLEQALSENGTT
jgi:hypothetical protein